MKKFFVIVLSLLLSVSANAEVNKKYVQSAEKYLNSVTGLSGDFIQTSNGKVAKGLFSMLRPGRVRLDYTNSKIQLISRIILELICSRFVISITSLFIFKLKLIFSLISLV